MAYSTLGEITKAVSATKPKTNDYKQQGSFYQTYLDELDNYYNNSSQTDPNFNYADYQTYRNYLANEKQKSDDAYTAYLAQENQAQASKIAQGNILEQSRKYAMNAVNAQGLGSQGQAQSVNAGVGNQFATNMGNIDQAKANNQQSIYDTYVNQSQSSGMQVNDQLNANQENRANNAFDVASKMVESATSQSDINRIKDAYYNQMNNEQKKTFDYYIDNMAKNNYGITSTTDSEIDTMAKQAISQGSGTGISALESGNEDMFRENLGQVASLDSSQSNKNKTFAGQFKAGIGDVYREIKGYGSTQNGTVFHLVNSSKNADAYLIYYNGKVYQTSKSAFDNAKIKKSNIAGQWQ